MSYSNDANLGAKAGVNTDGITKLEVSISSSALKIKKSLDDIYDLIDDSSSYFGGDTKDDFLKKFNDVIGKRTRIKELNNTYMYYINNKPKHLVHELIGTTFYVSLSNLGYEIIRFMRNKKIGKCIVDIIVIAERNGIEEVFFVEVQRHFNHITKCTDKYKELYYSNEWKEVFEEFPKVVVVSDMKYLPRYSEFEVLKIKTDCSDINKLLN